MSNEKQILANRRNARKSTGPKSNAGKRIVSFNALQHGLRAESALLPFEDPREYRKLQIEVYEQYRPEPGLETELTERICRSLWRLRRGARIENGLFASAGARSLQESLEGVVECSKFAMDHYLATEPTQAGQESLPAGGVCSILAMDTYHSPDRAQSAVQERSLRTAEKCDEELRQNLLDCATNHPGAIQLAAAQKGFAALAAYENQIDKQLGRTIDLLEKLQRSRLTQENAAEGETIQKIA